MNRGALSFFKSFLISAVLVLWGCSGTETGNPDISFFAEEIFNTYDSTDMWMPEQYLLYGEAQLSPDIIYADVSTHVLSKYAAAGIGDSVWIDTVILTSPIIVTDTIHIYRDSTETLVTDSGDTVRVSRRYSDSIFVDDTVIVYDTNYVERTYDNSSPPLLAPSAHEPSLISYDECGYPTYSIKLGASTIRFSSRNTRVVSTQNMTSLNRSMQRGDTTVYEAYYDADGDSLLFEADDPDVPLVELDATYLISNGTEMAISALFDGGDDADVKRSQSNRIRSFEKRTQSINNKIRVSYHVSKQGGMPDFQMTSHSASEPVESVTVKCEFSEPTSDHRLSALTRIRKNATYRRSRYSSMDLQFSFSEPIGYGEKGGECFVLMTACFPGGRKTNFEGRLVNRGNQLMGIYSDGDICTAVQVFRDGKMIITDLD